jgi:hypothetical protein
VDPNRILALVIFFITLIYLYNTNSNLVQSQSTDTADGTLSDTTEGISAEAPGNVINASDVDSAAESSVEGFQSSRHVASDSIDPGQSTSSIVNDQQESIDPNT